MAVIHLTIDLMAAARVRQWSGAGGLAYHLVAAVDALFALPRQTQVAVLAVDLQTPGLNLERLGEWVRARSPDDPVGVVYCYAQHVEESLLDRARQASLGEVMTRGEFFRMLGRPPAAVERPE